MAGKWNPGSEEAKKYGCSCSSDAFEEREDGTKGYWINMACVLHKPEPKKIALRQKVTPRATHSPQMLGPQLDDVCHDSGRCVTHDAATRCKHCPMPDDSALRGRCRRNKLGRIASIALTVATLVWLDSTMFPVQADSVLDYETVQITTVPHSAVIG